MVEMLIAFDLKWGIQLEFPFTVYNRLQYPTVEPSLPIGYILAHTEQSLIDHCLNEILDIVGISVNFKDGPLAREVDMIIEEGRRNEEQLVGHCFCEVLKFFDVDLTLLHPLQPRQINETIEKYFYPSGSCYATQKLLNSSGVPWHTLDESPGCPDYFYA